MNKNRSLNIIAILHNEKNQILTIKKKLGPNKNHLSLPCVFINFKERIEDILKREVDEKLSLIIEPLDILGVYSYFKDNKNEVVISIAFVCLIIDYYAKEKDDDYDDKKNIEKTQKERKVGETCWIDLKNISKSEFAYDHKMIIEDYLNWRNNKCTFWSSKLR